MTAFRAACVQMRSSDDVAENIRETVMLVREAAARGATFITTPENTTLMAPDGGAKLASSYDEAHDPALPVFSALAKDLNIWLLIGSLAIKVSDTKTANRSFLFAPDGNVTARYSKIHLFDVELAAGEVYRESNTVAGGDEAVVAATPWGGIGLTICYDVRFPLLYRKLAQRGAFAFTVPAAFTVPTGSAHWHVLLRARAIENGAFVIAPAQGGTHANGRKTYGHSLIISPWGELLAEAGTDPGVIVADIDPALSAQARAKVPNLQHDRKFAGPD
ncbi:MAG TPA: carbon-nitrogen hydrolase family protein [Rhizomicrobium sp.]|jgi:predicted amidohydrolase